MEASVAAIGLQTIYSFRVKRRVDRSAFRQRALGTLAGRKAARLSSPRLLLDSSGLGASATPGTRHAGK